MNASADPCVDFYEYACGNWPRTKSDAIWHIRAVSDSENKRRVKEMLNEGLRGDEIPSVKVAKQWYETCMGTESMDERGMRPLLSILDEIGGWPIMTGRNERNESGQKWQNIDDYYAHLRGFRSLDDVWVATYGPVPEDESAVVSVLDMPPYSRMLKEFFNADDNRTLGSIKDLNCWNHSMRIVSKIAESGGFRVTKDELEKDVEEMFKLEWKLTKVLRVSNFLSFWGNQRFFSEFDDYVNMTVVNWVGKLTGIYKQSGINIIEDTMLKVASPTYYRYHRLKGLRLLKHKDAVKSNVVLTLRKQDRVGRSGLLNHVTAEHDVNGKETSVVGRREQQEEEASDENGVTGIPVEVSSEGVAHAVEGNGIDAAVGESQTEAENPEVMPESVVILLGGGVDFPQYIL
ncbi:Putative zinc metalloproteinase T16A9.4 [Melipona quadrifasciata]|uniref:Putative zinc metalloproteinase T16A9.4 n=1 Tax=Melipona quadrifasciata TaxID=166423 RepID=A0A0M8ZQW5_9HYME|nr:Putative zinc metalloproteinase T16A9.4 [Melipona quadrifasciata]